MDERRRIHAIRNENKKFLQDIAGIYCGGSSVVIRNERILQASDKIAPAVCRFGRQPELNQCTGRCAASVVPPQFRG